jgi:hypothetical protein
MIIAQILGTGGDLLTSGGGGGEASTSWGRPEWWKQQRGLGEMRDWSNLFAQQITPEYMGHLRNAIGGNLGLDPAALQMMGGRVKQQMAPQFAMQQDALRSSFSPRLAGSGAMASAMQKLLSGQGQQMTGAQTDINIQDLLARFGTQRQALGQYGGLWGGAQRASLGRENAILRWLGM